MVHEQVPVGVCGRPTSEVDEVLKGGLKPSGYFPQKQVGVKSFNPQMLGLCLCLCLRVCTDFLFGF